MLKKLPILLLHFAMLALVCAIAAYWVMKIATPPPTAAPPPVAAPVPREADPVLAARMFGLVQAAPTVASNVQVLGVFSAGRDSSAVLAVDGKPARVVLLGQPVSGTMKLAEVRPDGVTLDSGGARQELRLPPRAPVASGGAPPVPGFTRDGNTLTAPTVAAPGAPAQGMPNAPGFPNPQGFPNPPGTPLRPMLPQPRPAESALPQNTPNPAQ
jgi:general secretion pathway protein C